MNTSTEPRLGVDFGRVIHGGAAVAGEEDTVFLSGDAEEAMRSPATEGMFDVLPGLVARFGGQVWVISKCGERIQDRTLRWLDRNDFYRRTGIAAGNVRFCRKRADKAGHCADLGITHMVDDRLDVHAALRGLVPHLFLFGPQTSAAPEWVRAVRTWADLEEEIGVVGAAAPGPTGTGGPLRRGRGG
ncbi:hypothetical protein [Actinoallomurus bryophytorum]|uniref:hypothetical protein n=1 Tax=Actinoallomurus bryophytorum TaxID=1490222 RepID=UPI001C8ADD74|nr:hypothetical protein [Actinoallomurus bryophytorum]